MTCCVPAGLSRPSESPTCRTGIRSKNERRTIFAPVEEHNERERSRHPCLSVLGRPCRAMAVSGSAAVSHLFPGLPCSVRRQGIRRKGQSGASADSPRSLSGCRPARKPTVTPSPPCSPTASRRHSIRTPLRVIGQMDKAHPRFPLWYLPWLGVDPALQGQGLGGELMEHCLRIVDKDRLPAYLETPNPRTIPFYKRYGFELTGEARAGTMPARRVHAEARAVKLRLASRG